jgi:mono/diheme cytochrome c family protein
MTGWIGAWGVTYAANLTPDKTTGIGNWTADQFIKAMRTGKHRGFGRPIMPPMPWFAMAQLQDDELEAIFAYLMSLPPIPNRVPDAVLNQ